MSKKAGIGMAVSLQLPPVPEYATMPHTHMSNGGGEGITWLTGTLTTAMPFSLRLPAESEILCGREGSGDSAGCSGVSEVMGSCRLPIEDAGLGKGGTLAANPAVTPAAPASRTCRDYHPKKHAQQESCRHRPQSISPPKTACTTESRGYPC